MLEFCVSAAVFAYVFSDILTMPGEILGKYGEFLERIHATRPWLAKPLGYCAKCFAGQVAFWSFPIYWDGFNPVRHVVAICGAILITQTIVLCSRKLQS